MSNLIIKADLTENFEDKLFSLLEETHKSGLLHYEILKMYLNMLQKLILKVEVETWLNKNEVEAKKNI